MNKKTINKGKALARKSHKIRPIRLSDLTWERLYKLKRGTWDYTISKLLDENENTKD